MVEKGIVYPGKDLEAMSFAVKYHRWLLDEFRPFIGKRVVEVGAGTGSFSEMLLETAPDVLSLVEPSEMYDELIRNVTGVGVRYYHSIFEKVAADIASEGAPDTIIYVNVLEHIEDDVRELELIRDTLATGGRALIFVPAVPALFSEFDRSIGHFRRYAKRELEAKVRDAGFKILRSKNFDAAGVVPWFVKYRLLRSRSLDSRSVSLYDNFVVPLASRIEPKVRVPIGKNVLLVAEK
jgi:SAM-dependent methyltransferase